MQNFEPPILELQEVHVYYGHIHALKGVSLRVEPKEIVALLGANGAGKTTTLRAISNTIPIHSGSIRLAGDCISTLSAHAIVQRGVAHAPEGRRIFPELTVLENLMMGAYCIRDKETIRRSLEHVYHHFPILASRGKQRGNTLSGGEQQMLAIGRALMSSPRLLLLDEPSLGLAPLIVDKIFEIIRKINEEEHVAILIVEQNANEALLHAHRAYVLETGVITMSGTATELLHDDKVRQAYLGGE